jgi:hypothetical protein
LPDRNQHLTRAKENEEFARTLDLSQTLQVDWAVTMLFYSALHYVDAFLAGKHKHPRDHEARDSEVENNGSLTDIYRDYRTLKDKSEAARYDISNLHREQFPPIEQRFRNIKTHI